MKRIFQRNRVQLLKYIMEEPNAQRPEPSAEDQLPAPTSAWHFAPEATAQPNITAPPRGSAIVRGIRAALRRLRRFFKPKERRAAPSKSFTNLKYLIRARSLYVPILHSLPIYPNLSLNMNTHLTL
ncbi:TPA: hypothetical protein GDO54_018632 [Pyxicephalus adspersus]|uniref:Uncharacterized protein n=1 Tax=Pyxicephalus adspersus TaxID=30357 RepID=A0AAV2ZDB7_PYXAD|nr:TPA: hypothetical protein GDO54_018632 [Pyxicephalus adspersus]